MGLRTVRRGCAALAFAAVLGLAGANPAAAEELGWLERGLLWFSGLWAAEDAGAKVQAGREPGAIWAMDSMDKGAGLDPNGVPIVSGPPPEAEDQ
ncbi:MAG TPA: hypothetical protein VKM72_30600 [Thermoanaerobaculia bacterium]|nr:hypothetical protein [Thermoanaerobaculia bacterium]